VGVTRKTQVPTRWIDQVRTKPFLLLSSQSLQQELPRWLKTIVDKTIGYNKTNAGQIDLVRAIKVEN
jgi:hypothetical protein